MRSCSELSPEAFSVYCATAQRRHEAAQRKQVERRHRAWEIARKAAEMLRVTFGATRVMVFGSLAHNDQFSLTSDIDLAVWDIDGEDYFVAVARLADVSPEFEIDLVSMGACQPSLREVILKEGSLL